MLCCIPFWRTVTEKLWKTNKKNLKFMIVWRTMKLRLKEKTSNPVWLEQQGKKSKKKTVIWEEIQEVERFGEIWYLYSIYRTYTKALVQQCVLLCREGFGQPHASHPLGNPCLPCSGMPEGGGRQQKQQQLRPQISQAGLRGHTATAQQQQQQQQQEAGTPRARGCLVLGNRTPEEPWCYTRRR